MPWDQFKQLLFCPFRLMLNKMFGTLRLHHLETIMPVLRIVILSALLFCTSYSLAAGSHDNKPISREQAVNLAQQKYPGKVLKVQDKQQYYRIRVLQTDGRVITVLVDGQTGRIKKDGK